MRSLSPSTRVACDILYRTRTRYFDASNKLIDSWWLVRRRTVKHAGTSFVLQLKITIAPSELPRKMRFPVEENVAA